MKIRKMYLSLAMIVSTAGLAAHASPCDNSQSDSRLTRGKQSQNVQEPKAIAPRDAMRALNVLVGDWGFNMKIWQDPAGVPEDMRGMTSFAYILNGTYLQGHYRGNISGSPFEGYFTIGYDDVAGQYVATWRHSYNPNAETVYRGQATLNATGNLSTLTLTTDTCENCGEVVAGPSSGGASCTLTMTVVNNDTLSEQMISPDKIGNTFKSEDAMYNRVQATPVPTIVK